jgi:hypothetical protein
MIPRYAASGIDQLSEIAPGCSGTSHRIDHEVHPHSHSGSLGEGRNEATCQFALLKDVCLKVDALLGRANSVELAGIEGIPIRKDVNTARAVGANAQESLKHIQEFRRRWVGRIPDFVAEARLEKEE